MSFFDVIKKIMVFQEPKEGNTFVLAENPEENLQESANDISTDNLDNTSERQADVTQNQSPVKTDARNTFKIIKRSRNKTGFKSNEPNNKSQGSSKEDEILETKDYKDLKITSDILLNKKIIGKIFHLPENKDLIIREFSIQSQNPLKAMAVFLDGLVDKATLHFALFEPLMILNGSIRGNDCAAQETTGNNDNSKTIADYIIERLIPVNQVEKGNTFGGVVNSVIRGGTAVFIEGSLDAILLETRGWKDRAIEQPVTEKVVRGPHEAFAENLRANIGLVRKSLPNKDLITEILPMGSEQSSMCAVMYLSNTANPSLVKEVKRRINSIKADFIPGSGGLEQFIEDHPLMAIPQVLVTEGLTGL